MQDVSAPGSPRRLAKLMIRSGGASAAMLESNKEKMQVVMGVKWTLVSFSKFIIEFRTRTARPRPFRGTVQISWTSIAYIPKTLVCLCLFLIILGYSFKLRWMFRKLYGSGG